MAANPSVSCACRRMLVAATLTAMIGPEPERGRQPHRQVLDHGAVHVRPAVDLPRREDAGQRARGRDRVGHPRVEQAGQAPHHLHAGMEIGGVDEEAALEVAEGDVADQARDQRLERLPAVERRGQQPAERDVHPGHLEHVPPADLRAPAPPSGPAWRPAAQAAPISDPMLDPTTRLGTSPRSSSARSTPMWASPLRPPPLSTRVKGRSGFTRLPRLR